MIDCLILETEIAPNQIMHLHSIKICLKIKKCDIILKSGKQTNYL